MTLVEQRISNWRLILAGTWTAGRVDSDPHNVFWLKSDKTSDLRSSSLVSSLVVSIDCRTTGGETGGEPCPPVCPRSLLSLARDTSMLVGDETTHIWNSCTGTSHFYTKRTDLLPFA